LPWDIDTFYYSQFSQKSGARLLFWLVLWFQILFFIYFSIFRILFSPKALQSIDMNPCEWYPQVAYIFCVAASPLPYLMLKVCVVESLPQTG
jgi:hypothetical protein